jgi:hypothetical protein
MALPLSWQSVLCPRHSNKMACPTTAQFRSAGKIITMELSGGQKVGGP